MRIYKYHLPDTEGYCRVSMPIGARVLSVAAQPTGDPFTRGPGRQERPVLWALVDDSSPEIKRDFFVAYTGSDIPVEVMNDSGGWAFRGTALLAGGRLVLHIFEAP